ncbi:hypothetical protein V1L52_08940 [Treponema sp. HNW]|uniref:hypothetical protein n=1 Tax=Treponema sp. HNW TaxID=3116654 RepID=UPI003D125111
MASTGLKRAVEITPLASTSSLFQNRTSCAVLNPGFGRSPKPITNGFYAHPCTGFETRCFMCGIMPAKNIADNRFLVRTFENVLTLKDKVVFTDTLSLFSAKLIT